MQATTELSPNQLRTLHHVQSGGYLVWRRGSFATMVGHEAGQNVRKSAVHLLHGLHTQGLLCCLAGTDGSLRYFLNEARPHPTYAFTEK